MDSEKKDYIIQEAEAIIANCEKQIDDNLKNKIILRKDRELEKRYNRIRTIMSTIILIETVLCVVFAIK